MKQAVAHLVPYIEEEKRRTEAAGGDVKPKGKIVIATVKGDRARHRQEHRHRRASSATTTRSVNMGVMVPCQDILGESQGRGGRPDRPVGPHHAEPRGDAARRGRDAARRFLPAEEDPLLIGGATTSRVHTAVKIAPHYEGPVIYVPDASRSVGVCADLLSTSARRATSEELAQDYARVRAQHASKKAAPMVTLEQARANKTPIAWDASTPPGRKFLGRRVFRNYDLAELAESIDWGPFFPDLGTLAGRFPEILRDEVVGHEAQRVFSDGKRMLQRLIEGRWVRANRRAGPVPGQHGERRRHRDLRRRVAQRGADDLGVACACRPSGR
jgi:5-methyltetrahydrofolate--homocysteine methyltransferase